MMNRRKFLGLSAAATFLGSFFYSCKGRKKIKGGMVGAASGTGHMLRDRKFTTPGITERKKIVIIGAGVSGLTAAYRLHQSGEQDYVVLDLEDFVGGNSRHGSNAVSAYPWGAHYVPAPNNDLAAYLDFLKKCGVITGMDEKGLPIYNEQYLCFDPEERLYINGRWQDGLVPQYGVPDTERKQISRFLYLMESFRLKKGTDGRDAFAIPVNASSRDAAFQQLDTITMKQWLKEQGLTSSYLHWYIDYCTRDDFGTSASSISAWMGIHYFASRKGKGANMEYGDVLTWPEGNGFLVQHLSAPSSANIRTGVLAVQVQQIDGQVVITCFDTKDGKTKAIRADHCIMAVPQFIAARILQDPDRIQKVQQHFRYTPWMVANLTLNNLEERSGAPPSWDNVIYNSPSLGYVIATHQHLKQHNGARNLTYYMPLVDAPAAEARKKAHGTSYEQWVEMVLDDLRKVHPNIEEALEEINVMLWGHAMVQPLPGMVHGGLRQELAASVGAIHFAHTDLAGASLFEEAFYQGWETAGAIINKNNHHV